MKYPIKRNSTLHSQAPWVKVPTHDLDGVRINPEVLAVRPQVEVGWETSWGSSWPRVGASERRFRLSTGCPGAGTAVSGAVRGKYPARLGSRQTRCAQPEGSGLGLRPPGRLYCAAPSGGGEGPRASAEQLVLWVTGPVTAGAGRGRASREEGLAGGGSGRKRATLPAGEATPLVRSFVPPASFLSQVYRDCLPVAPTASAVAISPSGLIPEKSESERDATTAAPPRQQALRPLLPPHRPPLPGPAGVRAPPRRPAPPSPLGSGTPGYPRLPPAAPVPRVLALVWGFAAGSAPPFHRIPQGLCAVLPAPLSAPSFPRASPPHSHPALARPHHPPSSPGGRGASPACG
ncbi:unnamed protein product [Rangifer tarandus platyrhynchus]|uniref:Uncharacterized protein n=1 Tax=Rangifer tarandus platyrhynchus TaxID=3082113 RepID=A0ABN8YTB6_RANTA|nr:unnamed protein product [Rangifer tarandus platyrhynchus]